MRLRAGVMRTLVSVRSTGPVAPTMGREDPAAGALEAGLDGAEEEAAAGAEGFAAAAAEGVSATGAAAGFEVSAPAPPESMLMRLSPTPTSCPSVTKTESTTPAAGARTSIEILSVSMTKTTSSAFTD